jgi:hypothetical protein
MMNIPDVVARVLITVLLVNFIYPAANSFAADQPVKLKPNDAGVDAVKKRVKKPGLPEQEAKDAKERIDAQASPNIDNNNGHLIEGQGLLINETRSLAGHNFVAVFTQNFNEVLGERSTITIMERVDPIRGNFITITVDDLIAFQAPLNPRQDAVEELAIAAAGAVSEFIVNLYASPTDLPDLN